MVTSKDGESDQFWAERQGANGYITKPFNPAGLAALIQKFVP
jgi:DNA-binding response OmpR family regulator